MSYKRARTNNCKLYYIELLEKYKFDSQIRRERRQLHIEKERETNYSRKKDIDKTILKILFKS